jgi:hypothetical protein
MSHNVPRSVNYEPEPELELSVKQLSAIPLLLEGETDVSVAHSIGVDRKTIYRWRVHDLNFSSELRRARIEIYRSCVDRLCNLLHTAMDVLEKQVKETHAPTCHRAARAILSLAGVGRAAAQIVKPLQTPGVTHSDSPNRSPGGTESSGTDVPKSPTMSRSGARAITKAIDAMNILGLGPAPSVP